MANDLTSDPLIVDTNGSMIVTQLIKVQKIRWAPVVASKAITLKDRSGKVKWKGQTGASIVDPAPDSNFDPPLLMDGLTVEDANSSGTLYLYLTDTPVPVKTA